MTLRAARRRAASSPRRSARTGRCSATSSATAWAAMQLGPTDEANTSRARPPISAERMMFASATTAGGSEIAHDLLLGYASGLPLRRDLVGQTQEDLSPHVLGKLGRLPGQKEPGGPTLASDEDDVIGAEHLARS